ncbi:MAG: hypothetical protein ACSW8G_02695 [Bacillota bacterium]
MNNNLYYRSDVERRSRAIAVVSYITWIGWIIAFVLRDRNDDFTLHHLNQALVINLLKIAGGLCAAVPGIGHSVSAIAGIAAFIFIIMGIYRAANWRTDPLPLVGELHLI